MHLVLLSAASLLTLTPTVAAASVVAILLNATQLLEAAKGWWGSVLPPKYQWIPGTVIVGATSIEQAFANGVTSWTQFAVPFIVVAGSFLPGAHSAAVSGALRAAQDLASHPSLSDAEKKAAQSKLASASRGPSYAARLVGMALMALALTGCNGVTADVESALGFIAKVGVWAQDADVWLQQNEAKIVALAPSADRALLQADLDQAQADYRAAIELEGDATTLTEAALAKDWAAFAADAEKLATDAEQVGLFKVPAAASSNAMPAGASPPPVPQSSPPPLPLIVRHLLRTAFLSQAYSERLG